PDRRALAPGAAVERGATVRARIGPAGLRGARARRLARLPDDLAPPRRGVGGRAHGGPGTSLEASPAKLEASARNIADAGLEEWIDVIPGDAFVSLESLDGPGDLVFLDAWKNDSEPLFQLAH